MAEETTCPRPQGLVYGRAIILTEDFWILSLMPFTQKLHDSLGTTWVTDSLEYSADSDLGEQKNGLWSSAVQVLWPHPLRF